MELLEREQYLERLRVLMTRCAEGHGRTVFVSGEAGIGKTSLIQRFTETEEGVRAFWGACDALFTPRPLGPLQDIAS